MLTPRQKQIAGYVATGMSSQAIADCTGLSLETVNDHIQNAARRLPGPGRPRHRITVWFVTLREEVEPTAA